MADSIKIGNLDISAFKVGSDDCKVYLGDTLLYSGGTAPTPTLQWVTFNNGDTIPSDLDIYGISGTGYNLYNTFGNIYPNPIYIDLSRNKISVTISDCYSEYGIPMNDTIELIFSNIGCSDYYNQASQVSVGQIQLYIYA